VLILEPENAVDICEKSLQEIKNKLIFWVFVSACGILFSGRMIFLLIYSEEEKLDDKLFLNDIFSETARSLSGLVGIAGAYAYSPAAKNVKDFNLAYRLELKKLPDLRRAP
jgi:hypothetical protein